MKYRNKKTGAIIEADSVLTGKWEPVEKSATPKPAEESAPKKKTTKKKVEDK